MRDLRKGRKLGRIRKTRRALLRSMASHLVEYGKMQTTTAKAKELRPYLERLTSYAKKGGRQGTRLVRKDLSARITKKLLNEIAPRYQTRAGGYTRITKAGKRKGDGAQLAYIEFV